MTVHNPLGTGPNGSSGVPVKVDIKNVSRISAGNDFSIAVSNGRIYGWGQNLTNVSHDPASLPV